MKLNTLTNLILATVATAGMSTAAFADNNARFEAQLQVESVNSCTLSVEAESGTVMAASYKYTTADQAAGALGTTTLATTEPLYVLVSSGGDECPLASLKITTTQPGIPLNSGGLARGIPTHDGGIWPVRWYYTEFSSYKKADGTDQIPVTNGKLGIHPITSVTTPAGAPAQFYLLASADESHKYGNYEGGQIPALSSAPTGGKIQYTNTYVNRACDKPNNTQCAGMIPTEENVTAGPSNVTVDPSADAASVRIGLAQVLATLPYSTTTQYPDPLTVFDTASGGGVPLTGTGTMTITPL